MKKLWFILLCVIGIFPVIAHADVTLEEEYLKGVFYHFTNKDNSIFTHQQAIFRLGGKIAYCLEPEVLTKAGDYKVTEGLTGSYLSKDHKEKVEEFGYYGYEYPNHQTVEYYLATQELIWELVSDIEVKWMTRGDEMGNEINIEKEKEEILTLIEQNKKVPSFDSQTIKVYEGQTIQLEDMNSVLDRFSLDQDFVKVESNRLIVENVTESFQIKGRLKAYDQEGTLLYRKEDSQKLATLRLSNRPTFTLNVEVEGISVKIHKIGEKWSGIWNTGEWTGQNGIEFEIYADEEILDHFGHVLYYKGDLVDTVITKNGNAKTKRLPNGTYRLVEKTKKDGYSVIEPFVFEVTESMNPELEVKNYLSTGKVEIVKKDVQGNVLSGVVFGLYSKSGRKLDEKTTDANGKIVWERLPIGEYQIRELKTLDGLVLDSVKTSIMVNENHPILIEKINVPLLPNTSGKRKSVIQFIIGLLGMMICKVAR